MGKGWGQKCPRCECGLYVVAYATKIGHVCGDDTERPAGMWRSTVARLGSILERRRSGQTLEQIALADEVTPAAIQSMIARSGVGLCRDCKLPKPFVLGRRRCKGCYKIFMDGRASHGIPNQQSQTPAVCRGPAGAGRPEHHGNRRSLQGDLPDRWAMA